MLASCPIPSLLHPVRLDQPARVGLPPPVHRTCEVPQVGTSRERVGVGGKALPQQRKPRQRSNGCVSLAIRPAAPRHKMPNKSQERQLHSTRIYGINAFFIGNR